MPTRRSKLDHTQQAAKRRADEARFLASLWLTPTSIARVLEMPIAGVKTILGRDANQGKARRDGWEA